MLLNPSTTTKPAYPILGKLLHSRLQFRLLQIEIVNRSNPHDAVSRIPRANTIHECPTSFAEIIRHGVGCGDGLVLREGCQVLLSAGMLQVLVVDDEVRGEHASGDLPAVGAVADEGVDETGLIGWELELHGAAEAGGCCFVFFGPAVCCAAREGNEGLGVVVGRHSCVVMDGCQACRSV